MAKRGRSYCGRVSIQTSEKWLIEKLRWVRVAKIINLWDRAEISI
jgi:hypothetical protein